MMNPHIGGVTFEYFASIRLFSTLSAAINLIKYLFIYLFIMGRIYSNASAILICSRN